MRRYDDPVEVRRGLVDGDEGPEQFLWRGRLWKVRAVLAHWVETGAWWQSSGAQALLGRSAESVEGGSVAVAGHPVAAGHVVAGHTASDLVAEREVWRVEAGRGGALVQLAGEPAPSGVFDLVFDWSAGAWRLTRCAD